MAKTLVISGTNYVANALDKVTFGGNVPCTGISLDSDTISITDYTPVIVGYTVTPEDTTDEIVWESSDTDVVTVENGAVTVVGIGTATITAACGNYSDSATVTVALSYIPDWLFAAISDNYSHSYYSNSGMMSRLSAYGAGAQAGEFVCLQGSGGEEKPVILFPKNTTHVKVTIGDPSNIYNNNDTRICFTKDESCGESGVLARGSKKVSEEVYNGKTTTEKIVAVPSGSDSMLFVTRIYPAAAEGTNPNTYSRDTVKIKIEFLASAE